MKNDNVLLGIDLGTSSVKSILMDATGSILGIAREEYEIYAPAIARAEQHPETWWQATCRSIRAVLSNAKVAPSAIAGAGFSGQMHGTVLLDKDQQLLRPAIIWADQRSASQVDRVMAHLGIEQMAKLTCNRLAAGFMAATLLWLRENEPESISRARISLLPKDYIRFRMTGELATDYSDASSTLLFDVRSRQWSQQLLELLDLPAKLLPEIYEAAEVVGEITGEAASETGLRKGTPVVAGGGDQPVAAFGNGIIDDGSVLLTIGTGGQLFTPLSSIAYDPELRTHTFCHCVRQKWFLMGAMLSAGLSLNWFRQHFCAANQVVDFEDLSNRAAQVSPGAESLFFLPYLLGERTPWMDADARGAFIGLSLRHTLNHLSRAILEGVTFAMRDSLEIFKSLGVKTSSVVVSGGGSGSAVWRQIIADIFGCQVIRANVSEQAAVGAAMLAGLGCGIYENPEAACHRIVTYDNAVDPIPGNVDFYNQMYQIFKELYPALKNRFREMAHVRSSSSQ